MIIKEDKKRNLSIDAVKGVAILLVMFGHVFVHNQMEDPYVYDFIKAVQMPLFIMISGYLCGQGRKVTDTGSYAAVMKKRAVSYLVPFFSWLTVMHLGELTTAYQTIFVQLDYGLWFFAVLFILTLFAATAQLAAAMLGGQHPLLSEAVFWVSYGAMCFVLVLQMFMGNHFLSPNLTIIYVPFYMLGYAAGNYGTRFFCWDREESGKLDCKNSRLVQAGIFAAALAFLYLVAVKNLNSMETRADVLIQMIASVLGSTVIIYWVCRMKNAAIKKILAKIGNYTLEIYVIHYHFARILNLRGGSYDFYTIEGAVFAAGSFVLMSMATFCTIWLMKKSRILNFLFFGKKS